MGCSNALVLVLRVVLVVQLVAMFVEAGMIGLPVPYLLVDSHVDSHVDSRVVLLQLVHKVPSLGEYSQVDIVDAVAVPVNTNTVVDVVDVVGVLVVLGPIVDSSNIVGWVIVLCHEYHESSTYLVSFDLFQCASACVFIAFNTTDHKQKTKLTYLITFD